MLNKGDPCNKQYGNLYSAAFENLNSVKKLTNFDSENWNSLYKKCRESFQKLHEYQKFNAINGWEIGRSAYYLSWLENSNYCRQGDPGSLLKAYDHYYFIRKKEYFNIKNQSKQMKEIEIIIKYFSRFIWICILVQDPLLIRDLLEEFEKFIKQNVHLFHEEEYNKYCDNIKTIRRFRKSIAVLNVLKSNSGDLNVNNRLLSNEISPIRNSHPSSLTLSEVVVFSNVKEQAQLELRTPDMYRILQLFEYDLKSNLKNPIKRFLMWSTMHQMKACILQSVKRLKPKDAFTFYISTDTYKNDNHNSQCFNQLKNNEIDTELYSNNEQFKVLYLRKPLLMIVDSKSSHLFKDFTNFFEMPLIYFLSPRQVPGKIKHDPRDGNLFTLFLSCPISALNIICDTSSITEKPWSYAHKILQEFNQLCLRLIQTTDELKGYLPFISDPLMQRVITRYCFCSLVLQSHKYFQESVFIPISHPPIDSFLFRNNILKQNLIEISRVFNLSSFFD